MHEIIYKTPDSWGSETYFFCPSEYAAYIKGMCESFDCSEDELEEPEQLDLYASTVEDMFGEPENGIFYAGKYVRNKGFPVYRFVNDTPPSQIAMEFVRYVD